MRHFDVFTVMKIQSRGLLGCDGGNESLSGLLQRWGKVPRPQCGQESASL